MPVNKFDLCVSALARSLVMEKWEEFHNAHPIIHKVEVCRRYNPLEMEGARTTVYFNNGWPAYSYEGDVWEAYDKMTKYVLTLEKLED